MKTLTCNRTQIQTHRSLIYFFFFVCRFVCAYHRRNAKQVMHECEKFNANMLKTKQTQQQRFNELKKEETSIRTHNDNMSINCRTSIVSIHWRRNVKKEYSGDLLKSTAAATTTTTAHTLLHSAIKLKYSFETKTKMKEMRSYTDVRLHIHDIAKRHT